MIATKIMSYASKLIGWSSANRLKYLPQRLKPEANEIYWTLA